MSFNGASFGAAKKLVSGVAGGLTSTSQNADGSIKVTYSDGNSYDMALPSGSAVIDDTETSNAKVWSSGKTYNELNSLKSEFVRNIPYDLVDYMETEKSAVKTRIKALTSTMINPIIIGFSTDQHCKVDVGGEWVQKKADITQGLKSLANLTYDIPYDLVVGGGDSTFTDGNADEIRQVVEILDKCNCSTFNLTGNHDAHADSNKTDYELFYPHITQTVNDNKIVMYNSSNWNNSGYMDSAKHKVRFIFIDNWYRNGSAVYGECSTMFRKFLNEMPTGYKAIVFSHIGTDASLPTSVSDRTYGWNNIIDLSSILTDYADKIICVINGHNHNDLIAYVNGIRHISTTTAGYSELNDGKVRTNGTAKSTVFDTYVIDTQNNSIHIVRFGVSNDRSCTIKESPSVTNLLDETTVTLGKRVGSSGVTNAYEQYVNVQGVTDYIAVENGDTLYFSDGIAPTDDTLKDLTPSHNYISGCYNSTCLGYYNSSKTFISRQTYATLISNTTYVSDVVLYENSKCIKSLKINNANIGYVIIGGDNLNNSDDYIITLNEEF